MPKKEPTRYDELYERAAEVFTPSAPIDHVDLFAGRWQQLMSIKDAVVTKGQHAIMFGERGVGKTSLASVIGPLLEALHVQVPLVARQNCGELDTFGKVWKRALGQVVLTTERDKVGFASGTSRDSR
ncbi:MAG TPA: hypothetical protein VIY73_17945, partial [Polyangiaceae bacterium]